MMTGNWLKGQFTLAEGHWLFLLSPWALPPHRCCSCEREEVVVV